MDCKLTVLIPVYNAGAYLSQAISSILAQSFIDFRLILLDDCSTDDSYILAQKFAALDSRIILLQNDQNTGIAAARDKLLSMVETPYFAWMDADDISLPDRFQRQISVLENEPELVAVSGGYINMTSLASHMPETDPKIIATQMLISNAVVNPAAMVRAESARQSGFTYVNSGVTSATDYAFWLSIVEQGPIRNIPQSLVLYRVHEQQESSANRSNQNHSAKYLVARNLHKLGIEHALDIVDDLIMFAGDRPSLKSPDKIGRIYKALLSAIKEKPQYDSHYLDKLLDGYYMRYCKFFGVKGFISYIKFFGLFRLVKKRYFGLSFLLRCIHCRLIQN